MGPGQLYNNNLFSNDLVFNILSVLIGLIKNVKMSMNMTEVTCHLLIVCGYKLNNESKQQLNKVLKAYIGQNKNNKFINKVINMRNNNWKRLELQSDEHANDCNQMKHEISEQKHNVYEFENNVNGSSNNRYVYCVCQKHKYI